MSIFERLNIINKNLKHFHFQTTDSVKCLTNGFTSEGNGTLYIILVV